MSIKSVYINLPVKDLTKTRAFWTALGFTFNEQFSDDKALCLVLNEGSIYSMLITQDYFTTFQQTFVRWNYDSGASCYRGGQSA